ncbi:MAG: hypothetical protein JWN51_2342, partial [Phycisphaerales bacterium]|nr:hypothetical protein [Phycisphaerales bacterium]
DFGLGTRRREVRPHLPPPRPRQRVHAAVARSPRPPCGGCASGRRGVALSDQRRGRGGHLCEVPCFPPKRRRAVATGLEFAACGEQGPRLREIQPSPAPSGIPAAGLHSVPLPSGPRRRGEFGTGPFEFSAYFERDVCCLSCPASCQRQLPDVPQLPRGAGGISCRRPPPRCRDGRYFSVRTTCPSNSAGGSFR